MQSVNPHELSYNSGEHLSSSMNGTSFSAANMSGSGLNRESTMKQKVNRIALLNLKEHDLDICACEECIYSRQLNRKRIIGLELSKNSTYRNQFHHQRQSLNLNPELSKINYESLANKHRNKSLIVDLSSVYGEQFSKNRNSDKMERPHPADELKFKGPIQKISSYEQKYPFYKGNQSPYIRRVEVAVPNNIKHHFESSYQHNYSALISKPTESGKIPDNLKGGQPWVGSSTYKQLFQLPNSHLSVKTAKSKETIEGLLPFLHQYQTTYRNQYLLDQKEKCRKGKSSLEASGNRLLQSLTLDD